MPHCCRRGYGGTRSQIAAAAGLDPRGILRSFGRRSSGLPDEEGAEQPAGEGDSNLRRSNRRSALRPHTLVGYERGGSGTAPIPISPKKGGAPSGRRGGRGQQGSGRGGSRMGPGGPDADAGPHELFGTSQDFLDYVMGTSFEHLSLKDLGPIAQVSQSNASPSLLHEMLMASPPMGTLRGHGDWAALWRGHHPGDPLNTPPAGVSPQAEVAGSGQAGRGKIPAGYARLSDVEGECAVPCPCLWFRGFIKKPALSACLSPGVYLGEDEDEDGDWEDDLGPGGLLSDDETDVGAQGAQPGARRASAFRSSRGTVVASSDQGACRRRPEGDEEPELTESQLVVGQPDEDADEVVAPAPGHHASSPQAAPAGA